MTTTERLLLAVAGAHLTGQPLNFQLTDGGAELVATTQTAASYQLYALATVPPKPGLVRVANGGSAIEVEVWSLTPEHFGRFVAGLPQPMTIGKVELTGGMQVSGFSCEPVALEGAANITSFGGWRAFLAS
jgi:allophanate hydrolase